MRSKDETSVLLTAYLMFGLFEVLSPPLGSHHNHSVLWHPRARRVARY